MKLSVLHCIPSFTGGGAERQLSLVAPALANAGVEVHVAFCGLGPNYARLERSDVQLHFIASNNNHDPALAWKMFQLVRRLKPDIVQTWLLQMDILGGAAALLNRVPLIVSERSSAAAHAPSWKTRLRMQIGRRAACIVANSGGGVDYWRAHMPIDKLKIARNCVSPDDHPAAESVTAAAAQLAGRPLVLFAGRFSSEKNISGLVEALILVARQRPDAAIMMFGEGPQRESAERRIGSERLSQHIIVNGFSLQLAAWMAHAATCVSVSHFEGHPNVVMEAAAARCPLVLSDIAAHRELFDESTALLVPTDSPRRIAEAVLETLHNPVPARERAVRAQAVIAQFDPQTLAETYKSIYVGVTAAHRRAP